jgi:chorismate synthase
MSSSFGRILKISTFGESHCKAVGVVLEGCPPRLELSEKDIQPQLDRRRPGQSVLTTDRQEADPVTILSGVENGLTLGTPIALLVPNSDQRPSDYQNLQHIPRPSHADYTYQMKYGIRASSGGGRSSARETIGRVAAGAIADKFLKQHYGLDIVAWVSSVGAIEIGAVDMSTVTRQQVDATIIRCPDPEAAKEMIARVTAVKAAKDSVGGVITCVCRNVPVGLGEPVFDKLEALLAQAMLSIPAAKGFEIGSGFAGTRQKGSEHNDPFVVKDNGRLGTLDNRSGGVLGGVSTGDPIYFKVAFKPPTTIGLPQKTVTFDGAETILKAKGRHDPCVAPRAVPIVESMAALVLGDLVLRQKAVN